MLSWRSTSVFRTLAATGGVAPYQWTATGAPAWLSLAAATGVLTGTPPAAAAAARFNVKVTDAQSHSAGKDLELTVS